MTEREIGVAIGIPEPFGAQLQGWRERLGDPNATTIVPHVTLLPPTVVATAALPEIEEHLRQVALRESAFDVHLRGSGTFRPVSPVVFVALTRGISECERLEAEVRTGPLARDVSFPYHPHVTVAHDVPPDALDRAYERLSGYSARFTVPGFTLFEQDAEGFWRPMRDFVFGGQGLPGPEPAPDAARRGW